ncbi:MAG: DUF1579 domain-containing protein [Ignavibacteria bacterium]|nr:DUF1579 domain-containing protein [Ignavibacteria bacterium]
MKVIKGTLTILMLFSVILLQAQDQADMMKKYQDAMTPGPMHQMLAKMVGDWKVTTMMPNPMTGEVTPSVGSAKIESLLGGRYFKTTQKGEMMGMPFEGIGIDAYDNVAKEFITIWIDNMGTGITTMKGKMDETTMHVEYMGEGLDPMTGQTVKYRSISKSIDEDTIEFDMFLSQAGQEMKMFSQKYERVK